MHEKIKILILDDDRGEWELMAIILKQEGIDMEDVSFYDSSKNFFEALGEFPRVIVLDYRLSEGKTGFDVMTETQKLCENCYYIIITGGSVKDHIIIEFLNNKADWFILKEGNYLTQLATAIKAGLAEVQRREEEKAKRLHHHEDLVQKAEKIQETFENMLKKPTDGSTGRSVN